MRPKSLPEVAAQANIPPLDACIPPAAWAEGEQVRTLAHDLGNHMAGIAYGLERLRGCQRTVKLEQLVELILREAEQGIAVTRALLKSDANIYRTPRPMVR
jgi:hypothetical protein